MMNKQSWIVFIILSVITGCSAFRADHGNDDKRTYPEALLYRQVSFQNFKNDLTAPDSININVYINAISECPPNANCILPDAIIISDSLHPVLHKSQYRLTVRNPSQFQKDQLYQLSLKIGTYPGNGEKRVELKGYSRLLRFDDL